MANEFMLLKNIICFLSLFDLRVEERALKKNIKDILYSKRPILLFNNECEESVGKLYFDGKEIIISANIGDMHLKAIGNNKKDEDLYCFNYVITKNNKDRLEGSYKVEKHKYENGVINSNKIDIYENNELIFKLIIDTIRNKIKMIDTKHGVKIHYTNNNFSLIKEKTEVSIINECGHVTYSFDKEYDAEKEERKERIYGYSDITDKKNYSEIEFGFILMEIYEKYFDILKEYKIIVNKYSPYLFEKVSSMTLKTLSKEKLSSLLDIEFNAFKGVSYQFKRRKENQ